VKGAAAIIFRVRIVIGDAFAAKVIESALHLAGNQLRTRLVAAIVVRLALIGVEKIYSRRTNHRAGEEARQCEETETELHGLLFHLPEIPDIENRSCRARQRRSTVHLKRQSCVTSCPPPTGWAVHPPIVSP